MVQLMEVYPHLIQQLSDFYHDKKRAKFELDWLIEAKLGLKPYDISLRSSEIKVEDGFLDKEISDLLNNRPLQYVVGKVEFAGALVGVKEGVLIPRPETEELVLKLLKRWENRNPVALDVCTGSGCIALALASSLKGDFFGLDLSEDALEIAEKNKDENTLKGKLTFFKADILSKDGDHAVLPCETNSFDFWVSNPPYIPISEKALMKKNVLEFEPAMALFVPVERPFVFYEAISEKGLKYLKSGGELWFEIHEDFGKEVAFIMENKGYKEVEIQQDFLGKPRFVKGSKY